MSGDIEPMWITESDLNAEIVVCFEENRLSWPSEGRIILTLLLI
jgi:hypothetical protein